VSDYRINGTAGESEVAIGLNEQGLPLGLQIIGKALDEQSVLDAAPALEHRAGFTARLKAWW
jgi:aspartyl-tRNA(Asn)/glutamyl-tRNA(Gln) amidotransferase subunit A